MAQWTTIDPNTLLPGDPWTSAKAQAAFENLEAVTEGAEGAPLISGALTKIISQQEIGAFIFARGPSTTAYGTVRAGSSLTYAGALTSVSANAGSLPEGGGRDAIFSLSFSAGASGSPSGSWVCLGSIQSASSISTQALGITGGTSAVTSATLWQRVA